MAEVISTQQENTSRWARPFWLFYGFLSGAVAWMIQLLMVWFIAELGCQIGVNVQPSDNYPEVSTLVLIISAIALVFTVGGIGVGVVNLRIYQNTSYESLNNADERSHFMTITGLALNTLFICVIIMTAVTVFFFSGCQSIVA